MLMHFLLHQHYLKHHADLGEGLLLLFQVISLYPGILLLIGQTVYPSMLTKYFLVNSLCSLPIMLIFLSKILWLF